MTALDQHSGPAKLYSWKDIFSLPGFHISTGDVRWLSEILPNLNSLDDPVL